MDACFLAGAWDDAHGSFTTAVSETGMDAGLQSFSASSTAYEHDLCDALREASVATEQATPQTAEGSVSAAGLSSASTTGEKRVLHVTSISPALVDGVCRVLRGCARRNPAPRRPNLFTGRSLAGCGVPIKGYISRFAQHCMAQEEDLVTAVILMDRASYVHPECALSDATLHRLFLAAAVVALKYRQDWHSQQAFFAQVGGVSVDELNKLERRFLVSLDFDLHVERDHYTEFCTALAGQCDFKGTLDNHVLQPGSAPTSPCQRYSTDPADGHSPWPAHDAHALAAAYRHKAAGSCCAPAPGHPSACSWAAPPPQWNPFVAWQAGY